jgi:hypothetical protein
MQVRTLCLVALVAGACPTAALAEGEGDNFETSLHYTLKGKETWYNAENGGFENWTGVPIEQLGCLKCHGPHDANGDPYPDDWFAFEQSCIDCHQVEGGGVVVEEQCFTCHAQQDFEMNLFGYADAHRDEGMLCWDCHGPEDMMGDGTVYDSLLAPGAIKADCESADCHPPGSLSEQHDEYDPEELHHGTIHCNACHTQSVIGCFNCHLDSVVESNVYRWQQPINGFTMLLNRHRDNKLSSGAFHGITYQGDAFLAVAPYRAHTNLKEARACTECHNNLGGHNPTIEEYNSTGIIQFTEWDEDAGVLTWNQGLVPIPVDWYKRMKFDFLEYDGATTDPLVFGDPNWSKIGKTTPDGTMMLYASPLSVHQMRSMGMAVPVELDLKPGGCPNPLNLRSIGLYPAAILGSAELDVFEIDELTLQLEGVSPVQIAYEDVAGPPAEQALCACPDQGPDGHMDMVLKFQTQALGNALGAVVTGDERMLVLTGTFLPDDSGLQPAPIVGNDCVKIVGRRFPVEARDLLELPEQ